MKVSHVICDFGGGNGDKCKSMHKCIQYFLGDIFYTSVMQLSTRTNDTDLALAPGEAVFFLGGRSSLVNEFQGLSRLTIHTNNDEALTVEMRSGLRAKKKLGQLVSKVNSVRFARKNEDDEERIHNEYLTKELTLIVVYHSDKDQRINALTEAEGNEKEKRGMIGNSITLGELKQILLNKTLVQLA
jgi:hypothetical protein